MVTLVYLTYTMVFHVWTTSLQRSAKWTGLCVLHLNGKLQQMLEKKFLLIIISYYFRLAVLIYSNSTTLVISDFQDYLRKAFYYLYVGNFKCTYSHGAADYTTSQMVIYTYPTYLRIWKSRNMGFQIQAHTGDQT